MLTVRLELYQGKKSLDHSCARVRLVLRKSGGSLYISRIPVVWWERRQQPIVRKLVKTASRIGQWQHSIGRSVAAQCQWQYTVPVARPVRCSPDDHLHLVDFDSKCLSFVLGFILLLTLNILGGVLWNTLGALQGGRTSLPPQAWHLTARIRQHSAEISCALLTITQSYIYNMENLYFFFLEE